MSNYSDSTFSNDENSSWFKALRYISKGSIVLDVGCSSGVFGQTIIKQKKCVVDGVEIDKGDIAKARKKLRNVYDLNIETDDLSIIGTTYDFIYFGDVIEHLVQPVLTLNRIKKLLKPEGKIVFSIPNMSHLSVRLMLLDGRFTYGETGLLDKTHLHFYTHEEVQRVFLESGYVISDLDPVFKDYPEEILKNELTKIGLTPNDKFINFARTTEASVYQFVGTAQPNKGNKIVSKKLSIVSPIDTFQTYLDETKKYYEADLKSKEQHIIKQQKALEQQQKLLEELQTQLDIKNQRLEVLLKNPIVRASRKLRSVKKAC